MLLQIIVHELEHKVELIFTRYYVFQGDDIGVLQFFEEWNLSDCSRWNAFILVLKPNFFQGHSFVSDFVPGFIHDAIGALPNFGNPLVPLDLLVRV